MRDNGPAASGCRAIASIAAAIARAKGALWSPSYLAVSGDAGDLLQRAQSLVDAPTHLLYLATAHAELGQLVKAGELYNQVIRKKLPPGASGAFRQAQEKAEEELAQLRPQIPRLKITVEGVPANKEASVTLDGKPVPPVLIGVSRPVDPGSHEVQASAEGMQNAVQTIELERGQSESILLTLQPLPEPGTSADPETTAKPASSSSSVGGEVDGVGQDAGSEGTSGLRIASYGAFGLGVVGVAVEHGLRDLGHLQGHAQQTDQPQVQRR